MAVDLSTHYLGLKLKNPLIASASPLSDDIAMLQRLEEGGVSACVMSSIFEEEIRHVSKQFATLDEVGAESFPEALHYFPEMTRRPTGPATHLRHLTEAKKALSIPVIGSINGSSKGGWVQYARNIEEAGADALELNIYFLATDRDTGAVEIETRYCEIVESVRRQIKIPLAVKIGPFFSSMSHMAHRLVDAGANGLVLFNRFFQPDIDLENLSVVPNLILSSSIESRLALRWIAILRGDLRASLSATGGAHTWQDLIKLLLVGADAVEVASCLLQKGPRHAKALLKGMTAWLEEHEYTSIEQIKGSMSQKNCPDPAAFERANYMKALTTYVTKGI